MNRFEKKYPNIPCSHCINCRKNICGVCIEERVCIHLGTRDGGNVRQYWSKFKRPEGWYDDIIFLDEKDMEIN